MFCNKCGAKVPDESNFCNMCGYKLPSASAKPPDDKVLEESHSSAQEMPIISAPKRDSAEAQEKKPQEERERTIWEGGYCGRALIPWYILCAIYVIVLIVVYSSWFKGNSTVVTVLFLVAGAIPLFYLIFEEWRRKAMVRYKLSTSRLFRRTGILSRKIEEIELIRIDDIEVYQTFANRLLSIGDVRLTSTDATTPKFELICIENPVQVKELIRAQVQRARKRTLFMESL